MNNTSKSHRRDGYILSQGSVPVIRFPAFVSMDFLEHGFSTRMGGVSTGDFASMNLSFSRGDDSQLVLENFRRFGQAVNMDDKDMVFSDQTHTTNIRIVTEADKGKVIIKQKDYRDIDGLITDCPGVPLVTFFADCVPLFFADPQKKVIAASHSGWRGSANRMGQKTVDAMCDRFGCLRENIQAVIGPSICQDCYEVSEDVADAFRQTFKGCPDILKTILKPSSKTLAQDKNGKYQLDLWAANRAILLDAGLIPEHIHTAGLCTRCHSDLLWSHRAQGSRRGSLAGFIMIRKRGCHE